MKRHRTNLEPVLGQLHATHDELAAKLLAPGPVVASDLSPTVQRIAQLQQQLIQEWAEAALEARAVLTLDQLAKAAQIKQQLDTLRAQTEKLLGAPRRAARWIEPGAPPGACSGLDTPRALDDDRDRAPKRLPSAACPLDAYAPARRAVPRPHRVVGERPRRARRRRGHRPILTRLWAATSISRVTSRTSVT